MNYGYNGSVQEQYFFIYKKAKSIFLGWFVVLFFHLHSNR